MLVEVGAELVPAGAGAVDEELGDLCFLEDELDTVTGEREAALRADDEGLVLCVTVVLDDAETVAGVVLLLE